jgi:hypothetical protein
VLAPFVVRQSLSNAHEVAEHKAAISEHSLSREMAAPRALHANRTDVVRF